MSSPDEISVFRKEIPNTLNKVFSSIIKNAAYYFEIEGLDSTILYKELLDRNWLKQDVEDWISRFNQKKNTYHVNKSWNLLARRIISKSVVPSDKYIDYKIPFIAILWPISEIAILIIRERLETKKWKLNESALATIQYAFCKKIEPMFNKVIGSEFYLYLNKDCDLDEISTRKKIEHHTQYKEYVSVFLDNIVNVYYRYPVLLKQLSIQMNWFIAAVMLFLNRFEKDMDKINLKFGISASINDINEIAPEMSDSHNQGQTVIKVTFNKGVNLIYKPRSLKNEESFFLFNQWLNAEYKLDFKPLKVLNCGQYGWIEYVCWKACSSETKIKDFYINMGRHLCLFYLLQATDFHYENLIAQEEHPVFVDMETLFTIINYHGKKGFSAFYRDLFLTDFLQRESYIYTDILDISSLNMNPSLHIDDKKMPDYFHSLSEVEKGRVYQNMMNAYHPLLNQSLFDQVFQNYNDQIMTGFTEIYHIFLNMDANERLNNIMSFFSEVNPRIIIRSTRKYCSYRDSAYVPLLLNSGKEFSMYYEGLWNLKNSRILPTEVVREEIGAILNFNIPYFTNNINRRWLKLNRKVIVNQYSPESTYRLLRKKLKSLSLKNLYQQVNLYYSYTAILKKPESVPSFKKMQGTLISSDSKFPYNETDKEFNALFKSQDIFRYLLKRRPISFYIADDLMLNQKHIIPMNTHYIGGVPFLGLLMLVLYQKKKKKLYFNWIQNVFHVFKPMAIELASDYNNTAGLFQGIGFATAFTSLYHHIIQSADSQYISTSIARKAIFVKNGTASSVSIVKGMAGFVLSCLIYKMCSDKNHLDQIIIEFTNKMIDSSKLSKDPTHNSLSLLFGNVGLGFVLYLVSFVFGKSEYWEYGKKLILDSYQEDVMIYTEDDETQFRYILLESLIYRMISADIIPRMNNTFQLFFEECFSNKLLSSEQIHYLQSFNSPTDIKKRVDFYTQKHLSMNPLSSKYYLNANNLFESTLISFYSTLSQT